MSAETLILLARGISWHGKRQVPSSVGLGGTHGLLNMLFAVNDVCLDAKLAMEVLGKVLGRIHAAVLAARTAETKHQMCESALNIAGHMLVGQA